MRRVLSAQVLQGLARFGASDHRAKLLERHLPRPQRREVATEQAGGVEPVVEGQERDPLVGVVCESFVQGPDVDVPVGQSELEFVSLGVPMESAVLGEDHQGSLDVGAIRDQHALESVVGVDVAHEHDALAETPKPSRLDETAAGRHRLDDPSQRELRIVFDFQDQVAGQD